MNSDSEGLIESFFGPTRLAGWNFAVNNQWDNNARIDYGDSDAGASARAYDWVGRQPSGNIAVEAAFSTGDGQYAGFGFSLAHLTAHNQMRDVKHLLDRSGKDNTLSQIIDAARHALGHNDIARRVPDYLELNVPGVENGAAPLTIWGASAKHIPRIGRVTPFSQLPGKELNDPASFHAMQKRPMMMEAVWAGQFERQKNLQYWITLPVSDYAAPERYTLSPVRYGTAAGCFTRSAHTYT
jgi:hypothetical protein